VPGDRADGSASLAISGGLGWSGVPAVNLVDIILDRARETPDRTALWFEDQSLTYAELDARSARLAERLRELGMTSGEWLGVYLDNTAEALLTMLAAMRAGIVFVPVNLMLQAAELRHILSDSGAVALIAEPGRENVVSEATAALDLRFVATFRGNAPHGWTPIGGVDGPTHRSSRVDLDADQTALVVYTSGTTGAMKGAMHTHGSMMSWVRSQAERQRGRPGPYAPKSADRSPNINPFALSSSAGVFTTLHAYWTGRSLLMMRKFAPQPFLRQVERHQVDNLFGVPTMFQMLVTSDEASDYDLSSVTIATCSGAPLAPAVADSFEKRFGVPLVQFYGQSETGPITAWSPKDIRAGIRKPGSVGKLLPGVELRIEDEDRNTLPAGEHGELVARSPSVMSGYIGGTAVAGETVTADGWVRTGDVGWIDGDGWVYISGRKRQLIIVGGSNVYPAEVENALLSHPDVREAAVVGVPDERLGEIPMAYVVAKPTVTEQDLIAWTRTRLAHYKAVRKVEFVENLPRGVTDKVLLKELQNTKGGGRNGRA